MLEKYLSLLLEYNSKMNLTAVREPDEIRVRHFEDSVKLLSCVNFVDKSMLDVGSGAGFPGLPLKIAEPSIKLTLLEATGKKAGFLRKVTNELGLTGTKVINERAEDYARTPARESFDIVTARGVAELSLLAELCLPFVKVGGFFLAMKANDCETANVGALGGEMCPSYHYALSNGLEHCVIVVRKTGETPQAYPRSWGVMKKKPL